MNTKSTLGKNGLVNKRTRLVAAALVALTTGTAASLLVGCGITKSGFSTDPLAGKDQYKQMQAKGVPQLGAPNQTESVEVKPAGYDAAEKAYNDGVAQVAAQKAALADSGPAPAPAPETAAAATTEKTVNVPVVEITLPEVPLPETHVLTFVENEAVVYRFKLEGAKAKASVKNAVKGMVFTASDDEASNVYDLKWVPKTGEAGNSGSKLSAMKITVGQNREHLLIVSTVKDSNRPMIEKVSLIFNNMNQGEKQAIWVHFTDSSNAAAETFKASITAEAKASAAVKQAVELTKVESITKQSENVYAVKMMVDTGGVKFGAQDSHLRFFVSVGQGERLSAAIPVSIKLNKKTGQKVAGGKK